MFGKITKETSRILAKEHENILKVVETLEKECELIEKGKEINIEFFENSIDFIRNYADKFHHAKEEDILFKEFNQQVEKDPGCAHCNPVEQMLVEHDKGRNFVKGMEIALKEKNKNQLIENARDYIRLIREHIFKEDNILYPMADEAITEKTEEEMMKIFKKIETEDKEKVEKHIKFVKSLK